MEHDDRSAVATFFAPQPLAAGAVVTLDAGAAHHARVRRLAEGEPVRLTDGAGTVAHARITRLAKSELDVAIDEAHHVPAPPPLHLLVPVADRDRMLWLAEKVAEFGLTVWQPVVFQRSRSVSPRGEGDAFAAKVRARMIAALEQSGGAWHPQLRHELPVTGAALAEPLLDRFVLDRDGAPLARHSPRADAAVALGPEGGMARAELRSFLDHGWRAATLGPTTLRFETAGLSAVALFRAHFAHDQEG